MKNLPAHPLVKQSIQQRLGICQGGLCLQAAPVNVVSPFSINTPNMLCSHSGGEGTKRWGGDVKQDQSWRLPLLVFLLRLPEQVSFLAFLWTGSGIHRPKKETELALGILGMEESLIEIVSSGALCIASVTSSSYSSLIPHIKNSLCSLLSAPLLLFVSVQLLAMQHSPFPLPFSIFPHPWL